MKKTLSFILLAFFLAVVIYVVYVLSQGRTTFFGKAANSGVFSSANSYVFASPLTARAGGDKVRVTVFALDKLGKGVSKKNVLVFCKSPENCSNEGIVISSVQPQSDTLGRALYDVSSTVAGRAELQASVEGVSIPQTVTVNFR